MNLSGNKKATNCLNEFRKIYREGSRQYDVIKVHRQLIKEGFSVGLKHVQRFSFKGLVLIYKHIKPI